MSERRLATIRQVADINPILGADKIEVLTIDGWEVVSSKEEGHKVGDYVVYLEIDSFLPRWEEFKFLEKSCLRLMDGKEGNRLRTIKLRGQISEGLVIKLEQKMGGWILNIPSQDIRKVVELDEEVTELLSITKWEPPPARGSGGANLGGVSRGNFPEFIPKTDEERIENFYKYFNRNFRDDTWEVTLKLDGSSFTAFTKNSVFGVCSRNLDLAESEENAFWSVALRHGLREKMLDLATEIGDFAVQGELMGPGVQGNREVFKELDVYVFNVYLIDSVTKANYETRNYVTTTLGLNHAPVYAIRDFSNFNSAKDFLEYAEGPSINHEVREGLVFKNLTHPNVSFKAISQTFKLAIKD